MYTVSENIKYTLFVCIRNAGNLHKNYLLLKYSKLFIFYAHIVHIFYKKSANVF